MKPLELYIVYISWGNGGKERPVLIYLVDEKVVNVFPIIVGQFRKSLTNYQNHVIIQVWHIV